MREASVDTAVANAPFVGVLNSPVGENMSRALCALWSSVVLVAILGGAAPAFGSSVTIGFDNGVSGAAVGDDYAALGVHFSNAAYTTVPAAGTTAPEIVSIANVFRPPPSNPIVVTFDSDVSNVQLLALDTGVNGVELDAFDAGGNLLSSDQYFGTGSGAGDIHTLSVSAADIRKITFYQPQQNTILDGVVFDNLQFTTPSEVVAAPLPPIGWGSGVLLGCVGVGQLIRRYKGAHVA